MIEMFAMAKIAAAVAHRPPIHGEHAAAVTKPSARTQRTDGIRAAHSFLLPSRLIEPAIIQFTKGGFRRYGSPPTYGTIQLPVSSIVTAGRIRRPSSPFSSVDPNPGR